MAAGYAFFLPPGGHCFAVSSRWSVSSCRAQRGRGPDRVDEGASGVGPGVVPLAVPVEETPRMDSSALIGIRMRPRLPAGCQQGSRPRLRYRWTVASDKPLRRLNSAGERNWRFRVSSGWLAWCDIRRVPRSLRDAAGATDPLSGSARQQARRPRLLPLAR
jgi:hypothetical protein